MFFLSVAIAAIRKPLDVAKGILPYVSLLALFAGFVIWNGSVVLGKYSDHQLLAIDG